ncbi:hypothetical protein ACU686_42570 [Yinghuangia aomiensis]
MRAEHGLLPVVVGAAGAGGREVAEEGAEGRSAARRPGGPAGRTGLGAASTRR